MASGEEKTFGGSCGCGRITFRAKGVPSLFTACHCGLCRKLSGGPYIAFVRVEKDNITWNQTPDRWSKSKIAERGHCRECGTALTMTYLYRPHIISVTATSLDGYEGKINKHIFLQEKAPWHQLANDGAERYETFDPAFQKKLDAWEQEQEKASGVN